MQDNFNLTGWVRNKKMLNENIEEEIGDDSEDSFPSIPKGDTNENQADWERFYKEGYLAGYAACQRGVPNRFAGGDEDMPVSDYSARRNSEKY
jgi:hypothetical protein